MTVATGIHRRRWRAPQGDGELLDSPALGHAGEVAAKNQRVLDAASIAIDGRALAELRAEARVNLLACHCAASAGGSAAPPGNAGGFWFVTGHQPVLAHPGVWVKNIAAAVLAQTHSGIGLNLIVDNDLVGSRSLAIPRGTREEPRMGSLPFDDGVGIAPWEEAEIHSLEVFERFGGEVAATIRREWGYTPLIEEAWGAAIEVGRRTGCLISGLSAVRVELERRFGLGNCEVRNSKLAQSTAFLHFVRHLARNAEQFRECHNRRLREYRRVNGVRSHSHPVADLAGGGGLAELPFWTWREGEGLRRRVFAGRQRGQIELSDGQQVFATLDDKDGASLDSLQALTTQGVRLRPRALATTLFARLLVADVFLHGIGGAKYDELTDAIGLDFFGIGMPGYVTLTGTWRLPLGAPYEHAREDWLRAQRQLRDVRYNAERVLDLDTDPLIVEKRRLVERLRTLPRGSRETRRSRRETAVQLRRVERELARKAEHLAPGIATARSEAERQLEANRVLRSREFAAVLHPAEAFPAWVEQVRAAVLRGPGRFQD